MFSIYILKEKEQLEMCSNILLRQNKFRKLKENWLILFIAFYKNIFILHKLFLDDNLLASFEWQFD